MFCKSGILSRVKLTAMHQNEYVYRAIKINQDGRSSIQNCEKVRNHSSQPNNMVKVGLLKRLQEEHLERSAQLTNIAIWLNCSLERRPEKEKKRQHTWTWQGKFAFRLMPCCVSWLQNSEQRTQLTSRFMQEVTADFIINQNKYQFQVKHSIAFPLPNSMYVMYGLRS